MDQIATEISNLALKIDAIEVLLKKPFNAWTEEEKRRVWGQESAQR